MDSEIKVIDIHTHRQAPYPKGVISVDIKDFIPEEGQSYSVGVHPWEQNDFDALFAKVMDMALNPYVVAIGECGVDTLKGGPVYAQLLRFRRHVELSEQLRKPLIIHDVKAHDIIVGLRRDLHPVQPWVVHGFRGKATVAEMLLRSGCMLSIGEKFNAGAIAAIPADKLFAETDESSLEIEDIIAAISSAAGKDMLPYIASNTARLLGQSGR